MSYFGNCQSDTVTEFTVIPTTKLVRMGKDLFSCETSLKFCNERELINNEMLFNDSLVINQYEVKLNATTKDKNSLQKSNKNLELSNKKLKLVSSSTLLIILIETLIIFL